MGFQIKIIYFNFTYSDIFEEKNIVKIRDLFYCLLFLNSLTAKKWIDLGNEIYRCIIGIVKIIIC